jgi:hypothetical protein
MANIDILFCKQVWARIATQGMICSQEVLYNQRVYEKQDAISYQEASVVNKVMSLLTVLYLRSCNFDTDPIILEYLISCILTSFGAILESSQSTLSDFQAVHFSNVVFRASYWLNTVLSMLKHDDKSSQINSRATLFAMIVPVFQAAISNLLRLSNPGKAIDLSFRCCLSTIRSAISALHGHTTRHHFTRNTLMPGQGHEIDDEVLMNIDMEATNHGPVYHPGDVRVRPISPSLDRTVDVAASAQSLFKYFMSILADSTVCIV